MGKYLDNSQLSQLSALIAARMGLHFPEPRWHDLERGLVLAAAASGFADVHGYCHWLLSDSLPSSHIEELSTHLTIGETYFFREKPTLNALREHVLPELIYARRASTKHLRIWSAGCCTGEEAYSGAMLLNQLIPELDEWMVTILATDINPKFLCKAVEGVYGEWSFRDAPANIKARYFTQNTAGRFEIAPAIKKQVKFSVLNLVEDSYPSSRTNTNAMDVIFCRNVLMYFAPEQAKKVVRKLYDSLVEGGWLIVSLGEASHLLFSDFDAVQFPHAILYQKRQGVSPVFEQPLKDHIGERLTRYVKVHPQAHWREQAALFTAPTEIDNRHASNVELALSPQLPEANPHISTSQAMVEQGHYDEAEKAAHLELVEKPEDAVALMLLARICANQGRLDEALTWCNRSLAADRLNLRAHYLYATIQEERGEIHEAVKALKRALYLHPEFILAHFALGYLARRQGKKQEADRHFANMFALLNRYQPNEILPESEGLTVGQMIDMVRSSSVASSLPVANSPDSSQARLLTHHWLARERWRN
jgi:chemotaxis protein methyltransferase CheR